MDKIQQRFVQICALSGSLLVTDAIEILRLICNQSSDDVPVGPKLKDFIADINKHLNEYDHDLAIVKYPLTKQEFIVFRTLHYNETRSLSFLSEQDKNFFHRLLTAIATAENYGIPEMHAINLTNQIEDKTLFKYQAEQLLQNWKSTGYFMELDGTLFLGPRTMVEFENIFLDCFPDVFTKCQLCQKLVIWEPSCQNCNTQFHTRCIRRYLIRVSKCPACKETWNTPLRQSVS